MKIQSAALTHVGLRGNNEDAFCSDPHLGLFAVADGMGGYEGGEVASQLAIETLVQAFHTDVANDAGVQPRAPSRGPDLETAVTRAVGFAHEAISDRKSGSARLSQMGTTLAALVVREGRAIIAHVGDSRVYRLRDGALVQLTRDHSLCQEMRELGLLTSLDNEPTGFGHIVTRALGIGGRALPDVSTETVRPGDVYLVCSDGLHDPLPAAWIATMLGVHEPRAACEHLVAEALGRGGSDNVTAVVVRIVESA